MAEEEIDEEVETQAKEAQTIDVDGQRVTQRSVSELIEAANHKRNTTVDPFAVIAANSKKVTH